MKYSCCIELLFTEYEVVERIYKAKGQGLTVLNSGAGRTKILTALRMR